MGDVVQEMEIVLYNGTMVKASLTENSDLFWASRGGGGGFGVITHFTVKSVASPNPGAFTSVTLNGNNNVLEFIMRYQDFFYDNPAESSKYGGYAIHNSLNGVFLGSIEQAVDVFYDAGLLDEDVTGNQTSYSSVFEYNKEVCNNNETDTSVPTCDKIYGNNKIPEFGLQLNQMDTQAETEAYQICQGWFNPTSHGSMLGTARSLNVCNDLGLDDSYCNFVPPDFAPNIFEEGQACGNMTEYNDIAGCMINSIPYETCSDPVIIEAALSAARDPTSFINNHGPSVAIQQVYEASKLYPNTQSYGYKAPSSTNVGTGAGGMLIPKLAKGTVEKLLADQAKGGLGYWCNHLAHGAPLAVDKDATAYPHRNGACNTPSNYEVVANRATYNIDILLTDPYFQNDVNKLMGYYNYMGSLQFRAWENFYFADHADKISEIRGKYDPTGGFDAPRYVTGKAMIEDNIDMPMESQSDDDGDDDGDDDDGEKAEDDDGEKEECKSIGDALCGMENSEKMCLLVKEIMAEDDDLASLFADNEKQKFTIFVPNDEAFDLVEQELKELDENEVGRILMFHFYNNMQLSYDALVCSELLKSMNDEGDSSRTKCDDGGAIKYQNGNGNTKHGSMPRIAKNDVAACNAALFSLDHVMFPVHLEEFGRSSGGGDSRRLLRTT